MLLLIPILANVILNRREPVKDPSALKRVKMTWKTDFEFSSRYTGLAMETREFTTHSPEETIALGQNLAKLLAPPKLVLLRGELGAGKTTLAKGIAEGFQAASQNDVTSPTFTLVHEYRGPGVKLYHIDLYRVDTPRQLETLGLDDLIGESSVLLIEWGEKFARFVGERDVEIALERTGENERRIRVISD